MMGKVEGVRGHYPATCLEYKAGVNAPKDDQQHQRN